MASPRPLGKKLLDPHVRDVDGAVAEVVALRCQLPDGVFAIGRDPIRLTWRVSPSRDGLRQLAYEIQASSSQAFNDVVATSGVVEGDDQVAVQAPGALLQSREERFFRVRVATQDGWTAWGPALRVEAGLLEPSDWVALAVTLPDDPGAERESPSPLLRKEFEVEGEIVKARLYLTSLGLNNVTINGQAVSDHLLSPGWTTFHRRLLADVHDVTGLLEPGPNAIAGMLGDGWYRGRLGWEPSGDRCRYGKELALIAQLEITLSNGTTQRIITDETWKASTGAIMSADLYDGAAIDLRARRPEWDLPGFDDRGWKPVAVVPHDAAVIQPRVAEPVRVISSWPVALAAGATGTLVLDGGQNITGFVRLEVKGKSGDTVVIRHAEVLESDGALHTRALRSAKATDRYVLADSEVTTLEPAFTFHGFRYAEVTSDAELVGAEFVAISSSLPTRGEFVCSDPSLNKLHDNVVWSQRDNFVSVPTDCPQRDERLGWTGDAQAFAATACTLFDTAAFWESWLEDLALDQDREAGVSTVVPDVLLAGEMRYGRAGWADAATVVPWAVYEAYGDATILERQLHSMRSWVNALRARVGPDGLLTPSPQFGDWLDPDAPSDRPWEAKTDADFIANAYFAHSARLVADAGRVMGMPDVEMEYRSVAVDVARLVWARWADHAVTTQTGCAIALQFAIAPESDRAEVAACLAGLVRTARGRVATGFLGTPLVLPALTNGGFHDEAYLMLLCRESPSWLYQVDQGATTVWERWDAIRPDRSIHPGTMAAPPNLPEADEGHMLSFNHYAYGAVIDWVYRNLAGIGPDRSAPGYRRIVFAPRPTVGIDWARASVKTSFGDAAISWHMEEGPVLRVEIDIPFGSSGLFRAPANQESIVHLNGVHEPHESSLSAGHYSVTVTEPRLADPLRALDRSSGNLDDGRPHSRRDG